VKPTVEPFNKLGIVPVKYSKELLNTIFADDYTDERYSVFIDNINLLYVAFTRAKEALIGFSVDNPRNENTVASVLKNALSKKASPETGSEAFLNNYYNQGTRIFEMGELTDNVSEKVPEKERTYSVYHVSRETESLKLKLHGEYYFPLEEGGFKEKINYGKLMHEVFEGIDTIADVKPSVRKLVLEGKIPETEADEVEQKIRSLIASPEVAGWFSSDCRSLKETGILLPSGDQRRPDRVIFRDDRTIIIDFKFGVQNPHYVKQINHYKNLLAEMGFENIEAFIWYVDNNLVVRA
jgi:ATP-dependent exoDNAse (exonuclease V) beta subunit